MFLLHFLLTICRVYSTLCMPLFFLLFTDYATILLLHFKFCTCTVGSSMLRGSSSSSAKCTIILQYSDYYSCIYRVCNVHRTHTHTVQNGAHTYSVSYVQVPPSSVHSLTHSDRVYPIYITRLYNHHIKSLPQVWMEQNHLNFRFLIFFKEIF